LFLCVYYSLEKVTSGVVGKLFAGLRLGIFLSMVHSEAAQGFVVALKEV